MDQITRRLSSIAAHPDYFREKYKMMLRLPFYDWQEELHWQEVGFGRLHSKRIVLYLVMTLCSMFYRFCGFVIIKVRKYSMNRVFSHGGVDCWRLFQHISVSPPTRSLLHWHYNHLSSSSPGTAFMFTDTEWNFVTLYLEGFLYGKMSCSMTLCPCWRSRSRTLFRNFRHVFATPIEQVQDINHPLRSLSPLHSIHCYHCQWFINPHTWSKYQFHQ